MTTRDEKFELIIFILMIPVALVVNIYTWIFAMIAVPLAILLAKFIATGIAIFIAVAVVLFGPGLLLWRKLGISADLGANDIKARYARLGTGQSPIQAILPVTLTGVGDFRDPNSVAAVLEHQESQAAGVALGDLRDLPHRRLFLVVTRDTIELWRHSPVRLRQTVSFSRDALESAIVRDHDPEHYKDDPNCSLKFVFTGNVPLWLDIRHRADPKNLERNLTADIKHRRHDKAE